MPIHSVQPFQELSPSRGRPSIVATVLAETLPVRPTEGQNDAREQQQHVCPAGARK
jgi:hypothetical protein